MSQVYFRNVLFVNGQPVAHAGPGGQANATEECWVTIAGQKVKQPFNNLAVAKDLTSTTTSAFYKGYPIATLKSHTSTSYGDEGSEGGVKSGTKQGQMFFLSASPNVFFEGSPACFHGNKVILNDENSEETTWIQPSSAGRVSQDIYSDPIEVLPDPKALNIELIRSPDQVLTSANIQQFFCVQHEETNHARYHTFGVFKPIENQSIWHEERLREGNYQVYEIYEKSASDLMKIPLGKISTVDKDNITPALKLVPLSFKRYDDVQGSADKAGSLYKHTYIYLFKDGYLWREFEMNHLSRLLEVDLQQHYLESSRLALGELKQGVLLPIQDNQGKHEFSIAVSKIRWSWEYIYKLGGVDPSDLRFKDRYRFLRKPDQALIAQRLQKIDIHGLISQGESCVSIPLTQTEADLLTQHQGCLPPRTTKQWLIEKEYLNLSEGNTKHPNDLYWRPTLNDDYIPDFDELNDYTTQSGQIPGGAVLLIHDPLGRLHETSKIIKQRQEDFEHYLNDQGENYSLAIMVGQMKEVLSYAEYHEVTREGEREKFVRSFDERRDALKASLFLSSNNLKAWYEASHAQGQWLDFDYIPERDFDQSMAVDKFADLISDIFTAFPLTVEGRDYLKEELGQDNSRTRAIIENASKFSVFKVHHRLISEVGALLASSIHPSPEALKSLSNFLERGLSIKIDATLVDKAFGDQNEFISHLKNPEHKNSGMIHVTSKHASVVKPEIFVKTPVKGLALHYNGIPFNELHALAAGTNVQPNPQFKQKITAIASDLENNNSLRVVLGILAVFNLNHQMNQLEEFNAVGELDASLLNILYLGIAKDALFVSEVGFRFAAMANATAEGLIKFSMKMTKKLGVLGNLVWAGLEVLSTRKAIQNNEYEIAVLHAINFIAAGLMIVASFTSITLMLQLNLVSFTLALITTSIKIMIEKNKIQSWIFDGYWGKTTQDKLSTTKSIQHYHFMRTAVTLTRFDHANNEKIADTRHLMGMMYPAYAVRASDDYVIELFIPFENDCLIRHHLWVQSNAGLILLDDTRYTVQSNLITGPGKSFSLFITKNYFPHTGYLGKIELECFDRDSNILLGKDAYALHYDPIIKGFKTDKIYHAEKNHHVQLG